MIQLRYGCRYSGIKVLPANWKHTTTVKTHWKIYYRFYAPGLTGVGTRYPKGKLVAVQGMNDYHTVNERREFTKAMIHVIEKDLHEKDYNPITGYRKEDESAIEYGIDPYTPLPDALQAAHDKLDVAKTTMGIARSVLGYVKTACIRLRLDVLPVSEIKRRHVMAILEQCGRIKGNKWTANTYNLYRSHLMMLFKILCAWEAVEHNPVDAQLPKKKEFRRRRKTLTDAQRGAIDKGLKEDNYRFWLIMQIFFYSGARETELVLVKRTDVDIKQQEVTYTIMKGKEYREETRPIPANAVQFWEQALVGATGKQFIFSKGLKPGDKSIRPEQITRRWRKWVKNKKDSDGNRVYGEDIPDFYSLKHSHSSEVASKVGTRLAALHNRHTEAILKSNYDTEGKDRDMEILKGIEVSFVPVE